MIVPAPAGWPTVCAQKGTALACIPGWVLRADNQMGYNDNDCSDARQASRPLAHSALLWR